MIRVALTAAEREERRARAQALGITPGTRDHPEMLRLIDARWSIPRGASAPTSNPCAATS